MKIAGIYKKMNVAAVLCLIRQLNQKIETHKPKYHKTRSIWYLCRVQIRFIGSGLIRVFVFGLLLSPNFSNL